MDRHAVQSTVTQYSTVVQSTAVHSTVC